MHFKRITSAEGRIFEECMSIYEQSFPRDERRSREENRRIIGSQDFHFLAVTEDENSCTPVGFITFWEMGNGKYFYGEHLATNPGIRNKGYGAAILSHLKSYGKPVILEIENPEDELTSRRKNFYERNGFILNGHRHIQLKYHKDSTELEMKIMTWPHAFSENEYEEFRKELQKITPLY